MNNLTRIVLFVAIVALLASPRFSPPLLAQSPAQPPSQPSAQPPVQPPATPLAAPSSAPPSPPPPVAPTLDADLTATFNGTFACTGEFANGRTIAADVSFTPQLDNRWLAYAHTDRPPNRYKAQGYWGTDKDTGSLVMVIVDSAGSARLFTSHTDDRKPGTVTFERTPTPGQKARQERFRFETRSASSFRMTYEIGSGDAWRLGDFIDCEK